MRTQDAERGAGRSVACRLWVDGKLVTFELEGPLVALAPASATTPKRPAGKGARR